MSKWASRNKCDRRSTEASFDVCNNPNKQKTPSTFSEQNGSDTILETLVSFNFICLSQFAEFLNEEKAGALEQGLSIGLLKKQEQQVLLT